MELTEEKRKLIKKVEVYKGGCTEEEWTDDVILIAEVLKE